MENSVLCAVDPAPRFFRQSPLYVAGSCSSNMSEARQIKTRNLHGPADKFSTLSNSYSQKSGVNSARPTFDYSMWGTAIATAAKTESKHYIIKAKERHGGEGSWLPVPRNNIYGETALWTFWSGSISERLLAGLLSALRLVNKIN